MQKYRPIDESDFNGSLLAATNLAEDVSLQNDGVFYVVVCEGNGFAVASEYDLLEQNIPIAPPYVRGAFENGHPVQVNA